MGESGGVLKGTGRAFALETPQRYTSDTHYPATHLFTLNPGPLRARFARPGDRFPAQVAKMCEFRHMFLKYAQSAVFPLKYAISGQENVR